MRTACVPDATTRIHRTICSTPCSGCSTSAPRSTVPKPTLPAVAALPPDVPAAEKESSKSFHRSLRSEEHTSELQSLMRISYAVFCLKKKNNIHTQSHLPHNISDNKQQVHNMH